MRVAVVLLLVAAAGLLEHVAGRLPFRPLAALCGLVLAAGGVALHVAARRALGPLWSPNAAVRARHTVVERGPYAVVRHPLYLAVLLLAAGTVLVHPSLATGAAAVGLAGGLGVKIRREERRLRAALGAAYADYAARVPGLVPGLGRPRDGRR